MVIKKTKAYIYLYQTIDDRLYSIYLCFLKYNIFFPSFMKKHEEDIR